MPKYLLYEAVKKIDDSLDHEKWVLDKYSSGWSCNQISEYLLEQTGIKITARGVGYFVHKNGLMRKKSDSFLNAIKTGRMVYKTKGKKFIRKGISSWLRFAALERAGHKCSSCGSTDFLEVDHIVPVANGGANELDNLTILCRQCNLGKFHYSVKKEEVANNLS